MDNLNVHINKSKTQKFDTFPFKDITQNLNSPGKKS